MDGLISTLYHQVAGVSFDPTEYVCVEECRKEEWSEVEFDEGFEDNVNGE